MYLANEGLPFKVLLKLDNAPGHTEPLECNTEDIKVLYLLPYTMSLIQFLDQGVIRTFKAYYTSSSMEGLSTLGKTTE